MVQKLSLARSLLPIPYLIPSLVLYPPSFPSSSLTPSSSSYPFHLSLISHRASQSNKPCFLLALFHAQETLPLSLDLLSPGYSFSSSPSSFPASLALFTHTKWRKYLIHALLHSLSARGSPHRRTDPELSHGPFSPSALFFSVSQWLTSFPSFPCIVSSQHFRRSRLPPHWPPA